MTPPRSRRALLRALAAGLGGMACIAGPRAAVAAEGTPLRPPLGVRRRPLAFPADHGAHPDTRTEWWYATGWLVDPGPAGAGNADPIAGAAGREPHFGFQITFFRSRTDVAPGHPSRFAAHQLVFAHAAVTDLAARRLLHDQRMARAGFGLARYGEADTDVALRDWHLQRAQGPGGAAYRTRAAAPDGRFAFDLALAATQPLLLQGDAGFSRKGPEDTHASHYYSQPQLAVSGRLTVGGAERAVVGRAWLDHEWSEALMPAGAVGWDWVGFNLFDGSALTAFRLRRADGSAVWAGGSWRAPGSEAQAFDAAAASFEPDARSAWRSPASGARYPVRWQLATPAGRFGVRALLDAQEHDGRGSTGSVYWEGLSELLDAGGRRVGLGYLEMTGYAGRLAL